MRSRGLFERYVSHLGRPRPAILERSGHWRHVHRMEHFAAIDSLDLSPEEAFDIGPPPGGASARPSGNARARREGRAPSPWIRFGRTTGFRAAIDGGGFTVRELGPKEATIELFSVPFLSTPIRTPAASARHAGRVPRETAYVREAPRSYHASGFTMRASWV